MRLIDADELKKDIMSYKTMPEIRKAICEVIDDAPTVAEVFKSGSATGLRLIERPQDQWIPVSERLPDKYDCYLVMWRSLTEGYPDRLFYEICEYVPEEDGWERIEQAGEAGAEIIAWMPLPEPYRKGGAE